MKKILLLITVLAEAAFIAGAYIVNYFTVRKMGMARYVNYKNQGWERAFNTDILKAAAIILIAALIIFVSAIIIRKHDRLPKAAIAMDVWCLMLGAVFTSYTLVFSGERMRAYYFVSLMLGAAALIQAAATAIMILTELKKDNGSEKK